MSVASLNNGSLQLAELVVSNEKYSNATGYVAASSSISSSLGSISMSIPEIVFPNGGLLNSEATPGSALNIQPGTGGLALINGSNTVTLNTGATAGEALNINAGNGGLALINGANSIKLNTSATLGSALNINAGDGGIALINGTNSVILNTDTPLGSALNIIGQGGIALFNSTSTSPGILTVNNAGTILYFNGVQIN